MFRIAVSNGDESYSDRAKGLSSSTDIYIYQPLIPQTNLNITLTTVFVKGISTNLTIGASIGGNGMLYAYVNFMNSVNYNNIPLPCKYEF